MLNKSSLVNPAALFSVRVEVSFLNGSVDPRITEGRIIFNGYGYAPIRSDIVFNGYG